MAGTTTTGKAKWQDVAKSIVKKVDKAVGTDISGFIGGSTGRDKGKGLDFDDPPRKKK